MMKHTWALALWSCFCVALFVQCNNQPAPADATAAETVDTKSDEAVAQIAGYWVNDAWWQMLKETRSPKKAAELAALAAINIRKDTGNWVADFSYNWHEGMRYSVKAEGEGGKFALMDEMTGHAQAHEIVMQPDGSMHIDTTPFVRIGDSETGYGVISATILGGTYTLAGKGSPVVFKEDGTVTGLDNYVRYELLTDYITDQANADQLMLYTEGNDMPEFFAFQWEGDQLSVFPLIEKKVEQIYVKGKLRYQLTRKPE